MTSEKPKFYCAWFCEFAQRAWIALHHKGIDFDYVEQNPYDKNPEWLAINPRGLVPTIAYKGRCVYESYVCIEYVDELWPHEPKLLPADPYERAYVRMWTDFINKKIVSTFYRYLMKESEEEREKAKTEFLGHLLTITTAKSKDGPFFMGKEFGMVDIMLVPHTIRFELLKYHRQFELPDTEEFNVLRQWHEDMIQVEGVKKTIQPIEKLIKKDAIYADNTAKSELADAIRKGTALPWETPKA